MQTADFRCVANDVAGAAYCCILSHGGAFCGGAAILHGSQDVQKRKPCSGMHLSKLHFARFSAKKRLNAQPPAYLLHSLLYIL
jgi:hypothetical protein